MAQLALETRKKNQVGNYCCPHQVIPGLVLQSADLKKAYVTAFHRSTDPTETYNCHGLTFGGRRTEIYKSNEVLKIISDDGYTQIARNDVEAGDIIVYFAENGDADHSGIIVDVPNLAAMNLPLAPRPKVLSKWGKCHEVVHFFNDCPYPLEDIRYYRLKR